MSYAHFIMAEGAGSITWWGMSPLLNILSLSSTQNDIPLDEPINILLIGAGDIRHLMKTAAATGNRPLHFYIIESHLELLARHILFLALFCEPSDKMGLREKTELFLELYGNTLVRGHTARYIREKAHELIKLVTDLSDKTIPFLDISSLKFKERDFLEGIFKFWRNSDGKIFEIQEHWEKRLRHHLSQRYDSRSGVFDWDYHMKLQEMVPLIQSREYLHWREEGIAFQLRDDAPYEISNHTLANGILVRSKGGEATGQRGYWGDIVTSPFIGFGSCTDNEEMNKKVNGKYVKNSQEISEYCVHSLLQSLLHGTPLSSSSSSSPGIEEMTTEFAGPLLNGKVSVTLLPITSATEIGKKAKFKDLFHFVYFSNSMVHHLSSGLESTMNTDNCTLICESAKFMLDLKKEHKEEYSRKVTGMAGAIGFKPLTIGNEEELSIQVFIR